MFPPFSKVPVKDGDLLRVQDRLQATLGALLRVPILDGVLLEDVDLTTTAQDVAHKLARKPLGFLVVSRSANSVVFETKAARTTKYINLTASATVTADIWVF